MPSYAAVFLPLCATYFLQVDNKITPNRGKRFALSHYLSPTFLFSNKYDKYLKRILVCCEILNPVYLNISLMVAASDRTT